MYPEVDTSGNPSLNGDAIIALEINVVATCHKGPLFIRDTGRWCRSLRGFTTACNALKNKQSNTKLRHSAWLLQHLWLLLIQVKREVGVMSYITGTGFKARVIVGCR